MDRNADAPGLSTRVIGRRFFATRALARTTKLGGGTSTLLRLLLAVCLLSLLVPVSAFASRASSYNGPALCPSSEVKPPPPGEAETGGSGSEGIGGTLTDPIDQKLLPKFGATSFWLEPWRSYMDTWPVSHLTGSLGINAQSLPNRSRVCSTTAAFATCVGKSPGDRSNTPLPANQPS